MIFIRIKVKGYLKNITENEIIKFEEKAIKNKNNISFIFDDVKYTIRLSDKEIILIRDGKDFVNSFIFKDKNSKSNYLLKENNYDVDIDVTSKNIEVEENYIDIFYEITDTKCLYEFKIEMSEII